MRVGLIGLGRMGAEMSRRLLGSGHTVVGYARTASTVDGLVADGAITTGATSLADLVDQAAGTADRLGARTRLLPDDRGAEDAVERLDPLFVALAPGLRRHCAPRAGPASRRGPKGAIFTAARPVWGISPKRSTTASNTGSWRPTQKASTSCATRAPDVEERKVDAETSPLRDPEFYRYRLNQAAITEVWRRGSVIASWLLDLTAEAFDQSPDLADFEGCVSDSGEGRWTSVAAIDVSAPAHVLTAALYSRFSLRGEADFADKMLSAMRFGFGGTTKPASNSMNTEGHDDEQRATRQNPKCSGIRGGA